MKFKPVVTQIELNPEQAVLTCPCYANSRAYTGTARNVSNRVCRTVSRNAMNYCSNVANAART